jgi:AAA family ATP:ADP antiporter
MQWLARLFDLREGEGRIAAQAFAVLFLIIAGHTMLETARDALFLSKLPPSQLNLTYIALAALSFVAISVSTRLTRRIGRRNTLICSLVVVAYVTTLMHHFAPSPRVVLCFYIFSGLVGAVLTPQFWTLTAQLFTVAQGRRLFGPIASGGVVGGVAGAGAAAVALMFVPVTALLPIAATIFVATALVVTTIATDDAFALATESPRSTVPPKARATTVFRDNPFLFRLALLVGLSTATVLTVDYLFKSTAASAIPHAALGSFFARAYAVFNGVSFLVQILVAGRAVKRFGVIGAVGVMPLLLLGTGVASLLTSGLLIVVLITKGVDGSFRHSLNRVATELLYLPVPADVRDRAKGLIDTVLSRVVQAAMAAVLYGLAMANHATPRVLALLVVVLAGGWLMVATTMRWAYLGLFRSALAEGTLGAAQPVAVDELDLASAEVVVEALASRNPEEVISAMNLLERKRRAKIIPALVLYHDDERVLVRALEIFGDSTRKDWIPLGERLLDHKKEAVRIAAVRAFARAGVGEALERALDDNSSAVHAYAAFHLALRQSKDDLLEHPLIPVILKMPGMFGDASREGLLSAIADAPDPRSTNVLLEFAERAHAPGGGPSPRLFRRVARAMAKIGDTRFIAPAMDALMVRDVRDAARGLLVALGDPAFDALVAALESPSTPRRLRMQLPRTLARFGTQRACDVLTRALVTEKDGLVRYRVLGGLGRLVVDFDVRVDRRLVEREARRNLVEHLRLNALRTAVVPLGDGAKPAEPATASVLLLDGLLADKIVQALERAFRLLKIAHKREDIHRVSNAVLSRDRVARANAAEFIDALLGRRDQQELRELFRLVVDDVDPAERVARASDWVPDAPRTPGDALAQLVRDADESVAVLAAYHAMSIGDAALRDAVVSARRERPSLEALGTRFFGGILLVPGAQNA